MSPTALAEAIQPMMTNGTVEIGAFASLIAGGAWVGKAMLYRLEKTLEKLDANHAEQLKDMRESHARQIEMLQTSHASQIETLTGIQIEAQRSATALTVQLDRYTRQMHDLTVAIERCPAVGSHKQLNPIHSL